MKMKKQAKPHENLNFIEKKTFYICSYGGSGSKMLSKFLMKYGNVVHIHDRNPPEYVSITKKLGGFDGTFTTRKVKTANVHKVFVVYLFRDPTEAQISRWCFKHFQHIQVPNLSKHKQILSDPQTYIDNNQDLLQYNQFFLNYTQAKPKNYNIYAVNYHLIFDSDNIRLLCNTLKLPEDAYKSFPPKKETSSQKWMQYRSDLDRLNEIDTYQIKSQPFLQIIKPQQQSNKQE